MSKKPFLDRTGTKLSIVKQRAFIKSPAELLVYLEQIRAQLVNSAQNNQAVFIQADLTGLVEDTTHTDSVFWKAYPLESLCFAARGLNLADVPNYREPQSDTEALEMIDALAKCCKTSPPAKRTALELIQGGFSLHGKVQNLTGRPWDMLSTLLKSKHLRCTASELRQALSIDDAIVNYPEQVVKDTASALRAALQQAAAAAGLECENPLPSKGKGAHLTYILEIP
jgi:hypothetical protein